MDEKNKKIIEMLREDGRRAFTDIAEELDVSEATVRKRVDKLEKSGVIKNYTVEVDPSKLGYDTVVLLGLDVDPEYLVEAAEEINRMEEVKSTYTCTGDHMIMAEVWTEDSSHLGELMSNKIAKVEGVKNLCPAIVLEEIKE
ncbi:MAG: Lrp/AsnC ligand binding domain-containing protein [Candidatus Aenigmatarchaeota archaeon]